MQREEAPIFVFRGPFGVPVEIHGSIVFLALLFVGFGGTSPEALLHGLILFVMLVVSVFLHEMGHAWGALVQAVPVRRVVLYGGGGYCQHGPTTRRENEFVVAMGPIVNLALWAVVSLAAWWLMRQLMGMGDTPGAMDRFGHGVEIWYYLQTFAWMNLALFALNMVPVQPLDGGKLFHHLLLRVVSSPLALRLTGLVGVVLAVLWVPAMVFFYFTFGWALLFMPSIWVHWQMLRGHVPVA